MLKGKLKFIFAILIIVTTVGYLVYGSARDTMVYYLTVEEVTDRTPEIFNERIRVSGLVVPGSIKKGPDSSLRFSITDGKETIDVRYSGIVPDIFKEEVEAVVEGEYSSDKVFRADILLAKCPTKYESEEQLYKEKRVSNG